MAVADTPAEQEEKEAASTRDVHVCACHADQELLGRQLADHPDPHVRIIAHMSNRQLAMAEQIADLTRGIFRTAGGVARVEEKLGDVRGDLRAVGASIDGLATAVSELTVAIKDLSGEQISFRERLEKVELRVGAAEAVPAQGSSGQAV